MFPFYSFFGFLVFSGSIKWKQWSEMGLENLGLITFSYMGTVNEKF